MTVLRIWPLVILFLISSCTHSNKKLGREIAAGEVYSNFTEQQQQSLVCEIASHLSEDLKKNKLSFSEKISKIKKTQKYELGKWSAALGLSASLPIFINKLFTEEDYLLQNAFLFPGFKELKSIPTPNYLGAFNYYANVMEVDFLSGDIKSYSLYEDKDLIKKLTPYLETVKDYSMPPYLDGEGNVKEALYNCQVETKKIDTEVGVKEIIVSETCTAFDVSVGAEIDHENYQDLVTEFQKANHLASPLFYWLLQQSKSSVTYQNLFKQSMKIYKDPWVSLGVLAWLMIVDSESGNRSRGSVVSKIIKPVILDKDLAGHNYHFWGYMLHSLMGSAQYFKYLSASTLQERILKKDMPDWLVDRMGLGIGSKIRKEAKKPKNCKN